ncbi:MAG TPA: ankyrin repeat domain-containing protein [Methylophilaceae bacterium]
MKLLKLVLMLVAMMVSFSSFAITDDEHVAYTQALRDGDIKAVKKFLDAGVDVNEKFFTWEALQIAANQNQFAVVKLLVERGADINYKHPITKMTALQFAAYENNQEMIKYLVSKGADINSKMRGNVSIVRAMRDEGNTKMVEFLLANGAKDDGCLEEKCN